MSAANLSVLAWDSGFFGFPVSRIDLAEVDENRLACLLTRCRLSGFRLTYGFFPCGASLSSTLLDSFGGRKVDERTTLARSIDSNQEVAAAATIHDAKIERWDRPDASAELLQLALDSGGKSRYFVDDRLPAGSFRRLYKAWIARSVSRQIADEVFVASDPTGLLGMATVSVRDGVGNVGLIAVRADQRGREVGSALMKHSLQWMRERRAAKATMVTQLQNRAAVRMCERCGFAIETVQDVYHFHLNQAVGTLRMVA